MDVSCAVFQPPVAWSADTNAQLSKRDDWAFPKTSDKAAAAAAAAAAAEEEEEEEDEGGDCSSDDDDYIPPNPNARNAMRCR
jgi:hypothetical protein